MSDEFVSFKWLGLFALLIGTLSFFALWTLNDYQNMQYSPSHEIINDCEKLGKWVEDKRINGNGIEMNIAEKYSDIYPIKCP